MDMELRANRPQDGAAADPQVSRVSESPTHVFSPLVAASESSRVYGLLSYLLAFLTLFVPANVPCLVSDFLAVTVSKARNSDPDAKGRKYNQPVKGTEFAHAVPPASTVVAGRYIVLHSRWSVGKGLEVNRWQRQDTALFESTTPRSRLAQSVPLRKSTSVVYPIILENPKHKQRYRSASGPLAWHQTVLL